MATRSEFWALDERVTFLNHGSYGACPRAVLAEQSRLREQLEAEPVRFMRRELEPLWQAARAAIAAFIHARADDVVGVTNATTAVNTVLRSLPFRPGDELLTTSHAYNACSNALHAVAQATGAKVVVAPVPLRIASPSQVIEAVMGAVTRATRLALIDHVTSPTALVWPISELVRELETRGVTVLVDGAHAPGMLPLDVDALGASFYTGNLHKWVCAPKGAAFLHIRRDHASRVRPLVISHGANSSRVDRSRLQLEFDWVGTTDPTAFLSVPRALEVVGALGGAGGWPALMQHNRQGAIEARRTIAQALAPPHLEPESMVGSMATVRLRGDASALQDRLLDEWGIEVPIIQFGGEWLVRVSMQRHVRTGDVERLVDALRTCVV